MRFSKNVFCTAMKNEDKTPTVVGVCFIRSDLMRLLLH